VLKFRFGGFDMKVLELDPAKHVRGQVVDGASRISIGTKVSWEFKQEPARRLPGAVLPTPVPRPGAECQRDPADGRLDELSWTAFIAPWETDVKASISWMQAVLNLRFKPGSRALVGSGGAAHYGLLLSSRRRPAAVTLFRSLERFRSGRPMILSGRHETREQADERQGNHDNHR
jgi:hypothetical protein